MNRIYQFSDEEFSSIVSEHISISAMLRHMGLNPEGSYHKTVNKRIAKLGLDISHLNPSKRPKRPEFIFSLEEVMVENSTYGRKHLKRRIIENDIIPYECKECGLKNEWKEKELILILDHINGISDDHRKENLRFLCPNCNSQQPTFAGRNIK